MNLPSTLYWTFFLVIFALYSSNAQDYCDASFVENEFVSIEKVELKYGRAAEPTGYVDSIDLFLDLYYSNENSQALQPMMILLHGGSFITELGDKSGMEEIARLMVSKGFVVASLEYRTWSFLLGGSPSVEEIIDVVVKAIHDLQTAIEYVVVENGHGQFPEVDVQNLVIGGGSAGAITALHRLYIDEMDELPGFLSTAFEKNGGLYETKSDDYHIAYGINLSGGIFDTAWIDSGETPLISIHGDKDSTVFYDQGLANGFIQLYGSKPIDEKLTKVDVDSYFYTFRGGGHSNIYGPEPMYRDPLLQVLDTGLMLIQEELCLMTNSLVEPVLAEVELINTLVRQDLIIVNNEDKPMKYDIVDLWGRILQSGTLPIGSQRLSFSARTSGYYALRVYDTLRGERNLYQRLFYYNGP